MRLPCHRASNCGTCHQIRRQQSLVHGDGERNQTLLLLTESLEALRLADSTLLSAAIGLGWIGTGTLTYAAREDNSMAEGDALNEMGLQCTTSYNSTVEEWCVRGPVLGFWARGQLAFGGRKGPTACNRPDLVLHCCIVNSKMPLCRGLA